MSYPDSHLPAPLTHHDFYILLALAQSNCHVYALKSRVLHASLGSVNITPSQLYVVATRLHDQGYIDLLGQRPSGVSGKPRLHYGISELGRIRLQDEHARLTHAVAALEHANIAKPEVPTDLQRLLLEISK
jgi:DNA-binding PadR family transcriptional regulator